MAKHAQESGPVGGEGTTPIVDKSIEDFQDTIFNFGEPDGAQRRLAGDPSWEPVATSGGHNSDHGE